MTELEILLNQLDELLGSPVVDHEAALEVCSVAGTAKRLGATDEQLTDAIRFRDGLGAPLIFEMWNAIVLHEWIEAIDEVSEGAVQDDEAVEDALSDFDDVVAAAIWCDQTKVVADACRKVSKIIRQLPDGFATAAPLANQIARLPATVEHLGLYDYWFAVADAGQLS